MTYRWLKLDTGYFRHRKTGRLIARLGDGAEVLPLKLWAYAMESQLDGSFADYSDEEIAKIVGWTRGAAELVKALKDIGFMDPDGKLHQWDEHQSFPKSTSKRASKAAKARWDKKKRRDKKEEIEGKHCSSNAQAFPKANSIHQIDSQIREAADRIKDLKTNHKTVAFQDEMEITRYKLSDEHQEEVRKLNGFIESKKREKLGLPTIPVQV